MLPTWCNFIILVRQVQHRFYTFGWYWYRISSRITQFSIGYFVLFIANKTPTYYQRPPKHHSTVSHMHKKAQLALREQSLSFLTCFSSATEVLSSSDIMWSRHLTWSMLFQPALHGPKKIHSFFIGIAEVKSLEEMSHEHRSI